MGDAVIVDDREPQWMADRLKALGLAVAVEHLHAGDYASFPHGLTLGIERSTISDLLGKMSSSRLVDQAWKMVDSYDIPILLREGAWRRGSTQHLEYHDPRHPDADSSSGWVTTGWAWSSFNGMMRDLGLMGILVWDCPVLGGAPEEIATIVGSLAKDEHRWVRERQRPSVLTIDRQYRNDIWALCARDGIGPELAEGLLKYGTYAEIISLAANAPKELTVVPGFGIKRAQKLHEEVTKKYG